MVSKSYVPTNHRINLSPKHYRHYLDYYKLQAGGALPKFQGSPVQYGYGLGGILRAIIRKIIPIGARIFKAAKPVAKSAFKIAKPHLKAAAQDLTKEAVRQVVTRIGEGSQRSAQTGSGRKRRKKSQGGPRKKKRKTKPKPRKRKKPKRMPKKKKRPPKGRKNKRKSTKKSASAANFRDSLPDMF